MFYLPKYMTKKNKINPGERYTQKLKLLNTVDSDFKKEVEKLRLIAPYPDIDGFPEDDEEIEFPELSEEEIETLNEFDPSDYEKWLYEEAEKEKEYKRGISELRMKFDLSYGYNSYLKDLIEFRERGEYNYPDSFIPDHLRPIFIKNPDNPKEYLSVISISPETSLDEVQRYWKDIKSFCCFGDVKKAKIYQYTKLKRDLDIFKLNLDGKNAKQIQELIRGKYPETLSCEEINIIISKLKKRATLNKK